MRSAAACNLSVDVLAHVWRGTSLESLEVGHAGGEGDELEIRLQSYSRGFWVYMHLQLSTSKQ